MSLLPSHAANRWSCSHYKLSSELALKFSETEPEAGETESCFYSAHASSMPPQEISPRLRAPIDSNGKLRDMKMSLYAAALRRKCPSSSVHLSRGGRI
jgi:hypothetical protein